MPPPGALTREIRRLVQSGGLPPRRFGQRGTWLFSSWVDGTFPEKATSVVDTLSHLHFTLRYA